MSFTESIKTCFQKYVDFSGRASRSEFWWFFLFTLVVNIILTFIPVIGRIVSLGLLLPSLAVGARRLHDTNRTGWWQLLYFFPFLGWIALILLFAQPGTAGPNRYGLAPLQSQQGMAGYPDPGQPYSPPPVGDPGYPGYGATPQDSLPGQEPSGRQFCTECGAVV